MILVSVLFLVPIYYTAVSKGYNGKVLALCAGIPSVVSMVLSSEVPHLALNLIHLLFPAGVLGVVWLLKPKPGAPGESYLKISFPCPECDETVTFPRHREGAGELCPHCKEVIHVPESDSEPSGLRGKRSRPVPVYGKVCFNTYGRPEPAHQWAAILEDHGIAAHVESDSAGGALPQLGNTSGHRVLIAEEHWEAALELENACREEESAQDPS